LGNLLRGNGEIQEVFSQGAREGALQNAQHLLLFIVEHHAHGLGKPGEYLAGIADIAAVNGCDITAIRPEPAANFRNFSLLHMWSPQTGCAVKYPQCGEAHYTTGFSTLPSGFCLFFFSRYDIMEEKRQRRDSPCRSNTVPLAPLPTAPPSRSTPSPLKQAAKPRSLTTA